MARRSFQVKLFDADPGWLGPKYFKGFLAEPNCSNRWDIIQMARNGGSFTHQMILQLNRKVREGKIKLWENCQIRTAKWQVY